LKTVEYPCLRHAGTNEQGISNVEQTRLNDEIVGGILNDDLAEFLNFKIHYSLPACPQAGSVFISQKNLLYIFWVILN
jgi:hypothetical protein